MRLTFKAQCGQLRGFNDMTNDDLIATSVEVFHVP